MASDPGTLADVLAGATAGTVGLNEEIAQLAEQLQQLQAASQASVASLRASAQASSRATAGSGSTDGSIGRLSGSGVSCADRFGLAGAGSVVMAR